VANCRECSEKYISFDKRSAPVKKTNYAFCGEEYIKSKVLYDFDTLYKNEKSN